MLWDILDTKPFSMDCSKFIKIPVGIDDEGKIISVVFGEGSSQHGLIVGPAGSGKSTLLHTIIMSSMLHYNPNLLQLYLMDFQGAEFNVYEADAFPHIQKVALAPTQESGEGILENLVSEMEHRISLFHEAGQTDFDGYRRTAGKLLPRILVIMDEPYHFLDGCASDVCARHCVELTEKLVAMGHVSGIHLLMATQSTHLPDRITDRMNIRIGLGCDQTNARYLFWDRNPIKAKQLVEGLIGTAVMNMDYMTQANFDFRIAYCDTKTQQELLDLFSSLI